MEVAYKVPTLIIRCGTLGRRNTKADCPHQTQSSRRERYIRCAVNQEENAPYEARRHSPLAHIGTYPARQEG